MQAINETYNDTLHTWRLPVGSTSPITATTVVPSGYKVVKCGPKLKGDKVTPNPWWFSVSETTCPHGSMSTQNYLGQFRNTGVLSSANIAPDDDQLGNLTARADQAALDSLLEQLRSADWGSNLAEMASRFEKPVRSLTELAESKGWRAAKRGAAKKARGRWRVYVQLLSHAWLQLQYVWNPLLNDIYGTLSALSRHMNKSIVVVGRGAASASPGPGTVPLLGSRTIRTGFDGTLSVRSRYACRFRVNGLATAAQITTMDPRVIAWNLLPYSFVVDWVYNVGGYLQNMETASQYGSAFVSGYHTVTALKDYRVNKSGKDTTGQWDCSVQASFREKSLARSLIVALPTPAAPSVSPELNSGRLLNLAALLAQALR